MALLTLRTKLTGIVTICVFTLFLLYWRFEYSSEEADTYPLKAIPSFSPEDLEFATPIDSPTITPSVTLPQGTFTGKYTQKYPQPLEEFLGIPYALPPTGIRRFQPPLPVNPSDATFNATSASPRCVSGSDNDLQSEDCLRLDIFRPKITSKPTKKLPVLVHIHGGAFNFGSANDREIPALVGWASSPIIAITFEYRLGALGFLPSKFMTENGLSNLGLKDQKLLLEWVRDNIESFGGDPENVTLMGPSAGGHSIGHHLIDSDGTPPMFAKAILESGSPTARAVYSCSNPLQEGQFSEYLGKLGITDVPEDQILEKLRNLSISAIKSASEDIFHAYNPSLRWPFQPCIDGPGGLIPIPPIKALQNDTFHHVPILAGYNTNEGSIFVPESFPGLDGDDTDAVLDFFRVLLPNISPPDLATLDGLYPNPEHQSSPYSFDNDVLGVSPQYRRLEKMYGDYAYISPVRQLAYFASGEHYHSSLSLSVPASDKEGFPPVYLYEFAVNGSTLHGAAHGAQYPFPVFSSNIRSKSRSIKEVAHVMHAYWTSFIISPAGDPNAVRGAEPGRIKWEQYRGGEGERKKMVFGKGNDEMAGGIETGITAGMKSDDEGREACEFWWDKVHLWQV